MNAPLHRPLASSLGYETLREASEGLPRGRHEVAKLPTA